MTRDPHYISPSRSPVNRGAINPVGCDWNVTADPVSGHVFAAGFCSIL